MSDVQVEGSGYRSNWWEGYIIRYALGSLVGALICWHLLGELKVGKYPIAQFVTTNNDILKYVVLLLMGLCYCYVASSPMLPVHVSRCRELKKIRDYISLRAFWGFVGFYSIFAGVVLGLFGYFRGDFNFSQLAYLSLGLGASFMVFIVQYGLLPKKESDVVELFCFYDNLSFLRYYTFTDIMTSYRHLREHGNAYVVLLLDFLFAWCLVLAIKVDLYLVVVVVFAWVSPAAYVWVVGTNIEKKYLAKHIDAARRKHNYLTRRTSRARRAYRLRGDV